MSRSSRVSFFAKSHQKCPNPPEVIFYFFWHSQLSESFHSSLFFAYTSLDPVLSPSNAVLRRLQNIFLQLSTITIEDDRDPVTFFLPVFNWLLYFGCCIGITRLITYVLATAYPMNLVLLQYKIFVFFFRYANIRIIWNLCIVFFLLKCTLTKIINRLRACVNVSLRFHSISFSAVTTITFVPSQSSTSFYITYYKQLFTLRSYTPFCADRSRGPCACTRVKLNFFTTVEFVMWY